MYELILEPGRAEKNYWRDLWRYRELFFILAWRDVAVRYKQTVIGAAWAVLRPLLTTLILTALAMLGKFKAPGPEPYLLFVLAGNMPWQFFATAMSDASMSLIANNHLVSKVYFPRLIVPAGSVMTSLVDFGMTLGLLALMMVGFRWMPDWRLVALPLFLMLGLVAALGVGLWFCALNVEYRDFRFIVPFMAQIGVYASPVVIATSRVPLHFVWHGYDIPARLIFSLNPMVAVIDGFRWCLFRGLEPIYPPSIVTSLTVTFVMFVTGLWYFRKVERTFADVI